MAKRILRILAIDDDSGCRLSTARYLTLMGGHMVEVAANGGEGLKKAASLKPDIILLDMAMPDMTGPEVLDALCASSATRNIPVIIVTGAVLDAAGRGKLEARSNFATLAQKPANFGVLLKEIETAARPAKDSPVPAWPETQP